MKKILSIILLFGSSSSFAQEPAPKLETKPSLILTDKEQRTVLLLKLHSISADAEVEKWKKLAVETSNALQAEVARLLKEHNCATCQFKELDGALSLAPIEEAKAATLAAQKP